MQEENIKNEVVARLKNCRITIKELDSDKFILHWRKSAKDEIAMYDQEIEMNIGELKALAWLALKASHRCRPLKKQKTK